MTTTLIHQGPAYELSLAIEASPYGHHLKFISFVPIARNPEQQVRFEVHLARQELALLHEATGQALRARAVRPSRSRLERPDSEDGAHPGAASLAGGTP